MSKIPRDQYGPLCLYRDFTWANLGEYLGVSTRSLQAWRRQYDDYPDGMNPASWLVWMRFKRLGPWGGSNNAPPKPPFWNRGSGLVEFMN
jgi:hypothetical protein